MIVIHSRNSNGDGKNHSNTVVQQYCKYVSTGSIHDDSSGSSDSDSDGSGGGDGNVNDDQ